MIKAGYIKQCFLLPVVLLIALLSQPAFAQERIDLTLTVFPRDLNKEVKAGQENRLFVEVRNTGTEELTRLRFASTRPAGWVVEFRPAEIERLAAGDVQTVDIFITPERNASQRGFSITIIAEANEVRRVTDVFLTVTSPSLDFVLTVTPRSFNNEVRAGRENRLFVEVRNTGTDELKGIKFSSDEPRGWSVEFRPGEIERLEAGRLQTIDIIVTPEAKTTRGSHVVTVIAEANEIKRVTNIFLTVKSSSFWPLLGGIIGVIAVAVFIFIFMRLGRQQ
ncbi:MAG: hypothetical protein HYX84_00675 [Chloroflexi bacterium]|nr:hypothetical protein [Chloroflexota bacterium]